jgi:D-aminopeptidase
MERHDAVDAEAHESISARLDRLFAPWSRSDAPGLVVGIARGGKTLFRKGFGMASLESAAANTPRTRMRIGSTSKHFTCVLALLLAEDGLLDLDRPLRSYLPDLVGPGGDPTLRELMQHRGGGRCYLDLAYLTHGVGLSPANAAMAAQARQTGRNFAPGDAMLYNNSGYHLLSLVIERAAGAPFEQLLDERLFTPLALRDTASVRSDYDITPGIATLHVPSGSGLWRRGLFQTEHILGEGAIVSTLDDMLAWVQHLRESDRIVTPASWAALTAPDAYPDGRPGSYALGLINTRYRGLLVLHHPGGVMGGSSSMLTVPGDALDIVILSNGAPGADVLQLTYRIIDIVLEDRVAARDYVLTTQGNQAWCGDWWSPETGMVYSIVEMQGALKIRACRNDLSGGGVLRPVSDGHAVYPEFAIGQIDLTLDRTLADPVLHIGFGGSVATYRRVTESETPSSEFVALVAGCYNSIDADAVAVIIRDSAGLRITFSDRFGSFDADLHELAPTLGFFETHSVTGQPNAVLNFDGGAPGADRFVLHTVRTRNLVFERARPKPLPEAPRPILFLAMV